MQNQSSSMEQAGGFSSNPVHPIWRRALSLLAIAALSFAVSILLTIILLAKAPPVRGVVFSFGSPQHDLPFYFTLFALLLVFAAPLAVMVYGLRRGWLTWRLQAAVWVLLAGVAVDLAMDDPVLNLPATLDELAPALPGDEASYKVMSRFSLTQSDPILKADPPGAQIVAKLKGDKTDSDVLRQHRDEIEAGWAAITILNDWFAELSAFPRIGDLLEKTDDPIPSFRLIRTYSRFACAHAQLLALDGKGDEALALLGQVMDVSQKMEATSRSLVRIMISIVVEKMALERMAYVLDNATVSPPARANLEAILARGMTGQAGARRMMLVDYVAFMVPTFLNMHLGDMIGDFAPSRNILSHPLNWLDPLLNNPRATLNLAGDCFNRLADLAAKRDFAGISVLDDRLEVEWSGAIPIKNVGGRFMLSMAVPAFSKMAQQYWQEQDTATALLARLKAMDEPK